VETLTKRQLEIVTLVAEGLTNIEIASRLKIGPESVKTHLLAACRKLDARNRTHVVHRAHLAGYLSGATSVPSRDT